MRYGLFAYGTANIGDDIQSWATASFLPKIDTLVFRDLLWAYESTQRTMVVMNSWFMLGRENFHKPPSDGIVPIFHGFSIGPKELLDRDWLNYYRKHQPIGCRDLWTRNQLRKRGIDAYWSGCLTAMLEPPDRIGEDAREGVFIVDVDPELERRLIPPEIRKDAIRSTHQIKPENRRNLAARLELARTLLEDYRRARLVITRRLHAALPCLAYGTPVIVLLDDSIPYVASRWRGFEEVLPVFGLNDTNKIDIDWDAPPISRRPKQFDEAAELMRTRIAECENFGLTETTEENAQILRLPNVPVGTLVTLKGKNFGEQTGQVRLQVGSVVMTIGTAKWNNISVTVQVPDLRMPSTIDAQLQIFRADGAYISSSIVRFPPVAP